MKKEDLRTGMLVENRDGKVFIVMLRDKDNSIISKNSFDLLSNYKDNLCAVRHSNLDIMKVYSFSNNKNGLSLSKEGRELLWERKEEESHEYEIRINVDDGKHGVTKRFHSKKDNSNNDLMKAVNGMMSDLTEEADSPKYKVRDTVEMCDGTVGAIDSVWDKIHELTTQYYVVTRDSKGAFGVCSDKSLVAESRIKRKIN